MRIINWSISKLYQLIQIFYDRKILVFYAAKQRNFDVKFQDFLNLDNDKFLLNANTFN